MENRRSCLCAAQDRDDSCSLEVPGLDGTFEVDEVFCVGSEATSCDSVISIKDIPGLPSRGAGIVLLCKGDWFERAARS